MNIRIVLPVALLAAGCAHAPVPPPTDEFLADRLFAPPSERISRSDVFALSPEMKRYLATDIAAETHEKGLQQGLFDALYSRNQLQLEYETTITRNAAQAFADRVGNCLSLVIMTGAFAKEMGLRVTFQQTYVDEAWGRVDNLYLSIGHVNITLGVDRSDSAALRDLNRMTIDFLPPADIRGLRTRAIREDTVVAMYMNNRAVESMAARRYDDAYWWAREAIAQDREFMPSYNTLGAVYARHGDLERSERVLAYALAAEPENTLVMSNLIPVLEGLGRTAKAEELKRTLARLEPDPPFSFFNRGLAAMRAGDYALAKEMFAREVDRAPYYHEFHFWLASAYVGLGEFDLARRHMAVAIRSGPTRSEREIYAAKLDRINAHRAQ